MRKMEIRALIVCAEEATGRIPFLGFKLTTRKQVSSKRSFLFMLPALDTVLCLSGCAFTALFQPMSSHASELGHLTVYKIPDFQLLMFRSSYIKHVRRQPLLDFPHASRPLW